MTTPTIRGRTALVTGAGRGIGRAIAVALAKEGCSVALLARGAEELDETAHQCQGHGVETLCLPADITETGAIEEAIARCAEGMGGLNILVNNVGLFHWGSALDADPDAWDRLIDVNLRAAMRATRRALPLIVYEEH